MSDLDDELFDMGIRRIDQYRAERGADWMYEGLIPYDAFGVLLGDSGVGKSTLAVDLAVAIATGTPFAGYEFSDGTASAYETQTEPLTGRAVLYIYGEGGASLDARVAAAYEARVQGFSSTRRHGLEHKGINELSVLARELVCTSDGPTSLRAFVAEFLRKDSSMTIAMQTGLPLGLIVVDTWTATVGLTNENDNSVTQDRVNSLKELAKTFESTVLVVAHTKKGTDEMRGATSVVNAADFVLRIEKKKSNTDKLSLVHQKARHGPTQTTKHFRLLPMDGGDGNGLQPLIVDWLEENETNRPQASTRTMNDSLIVRHSQLEKVERDEESSFDVYMEAVRLAILSQGVSDVDGLPGVAPAVIRTWFDSMYRRNPEANRKAFERANIRAISERRVAVSAMDDRRQLVRIVE